MSDALAEIRRAAAARYSKVPQADRPQLRLCDHCKKPIYDSKVCSATGRYHLVDEKHTLRIGTAIMGSETKVVEGRELMAAFEANRIRWQEARTKIVKLDRDSAEIFQSFTMSRQWKLMRYGILYGTVDTNEKSVTVHTIYEPTQHGDEKTFVPHDPDANEEKADALAALFGLSRVGVICTHGPRDKHAIPLSSTELITCTREQSRFGDHCVIVTVGPATDQGNQITADAWQATEQSVNLYRAGLIDICDQSEQYIQSKETLEVVLAAEVGKDGKKLPPKSMEPSHFVDTKWLTGYLAIEAFSSPLFTNRFARYDRPGELPLTHSNIGAFLQSPNRAHLPFSEKISDFPFLFFLAVSGVFDQKSLGALVHALRQPKGDADAAAVLKNSEANLMATFKR